MQRWTINSLGVLLAVVFLILSCKKNNSETNANRVDSPPVERLIDSVSVLYYNHIFENEPINWGIIELDYKRGDKGVLTATLTDKTLLVKLHGLIKTLETQDNNELADVRIAAVIKYNDGTCDSLSVGDVYANRIYLNQKPQKTNNLLLFVLKNNIGYYPWMIGDAMMKMPELRDPSFPKEPFKSSVHYEAYQQRLRNK